MAKLQSSDLLDFATLPPITLPHKDMINPIMQVESSIYIHAATGTVWRAFSDVSKWSSWYPGVINAKWITGEPWQEAANLQVQVKSSLGLPAVSNGIVRMNMPNHRLVWESAMPMLNVVCSALFEDELGGCKLTIRKTYHGLLAPLLLLLRGRHQRLLTDGLETLRERIEKS